MIDLSTEIQTIKEKYQPRYELSDGALREAAALWGGNPNRHGVLPSQPETVVDTGGCIGTISFAETSKGYWLMGISASSSFNGYGYAPSVWHTTAFSNRYTARLAGVMKLIDFFSKVASDTSSTNSETNKAAAKDALRILEGEKTPQLSLF